MSLGAIDKYLGAVACEDIPKRICIDIDVWWTYEHHSVKIGLFRGCVKVGRLVWFYVGISGKLSEVLNSKLKRGARADFDVLTLDGEIYI